MTKLKFISLLLMAFTFGLAACTDKAIDADSSITEKWNNAIDGKSDPRHDWTTAYNLQLNIVGNRGDTVRVIRTGQEKPTLLSYMVMQGNGVMKVEVPQDIEGSVGLICNSPKGRKYQRIYLGKEKNQEVDVDLLHDTNSSSPMPRDATNNQTRVVANPADTPLPNPTGTHDSKLDQYIGFQYYDQLTYSTTYYTVQLPAWTWDDILLAMPEGIPANANNSENPSFEFTSHGEDWYGVGDDITPLRLVYCYGDILTDSPEKNVTLGIYTHSDNSYADLDLCPFTGTKNSDYIIDYVRDNILSKVQYQLDGNDTWYDANFCKLDGENILVNDKNEKVSIQDDSPRKGDGIYGTSLIQNNYGNRVSAIRGAEQTVSIKKGTKYGFYVATSHTDKLKEQKELLKSKGVPDNIINNIEGNIFFSNTELNIPVETNNSNQSLSYRCIYKKYGNLAFIGFDDCYKKSDKSIGYGDADCNDIVICVMDNQYRPAPHSDDYTFDRNERIYAFENLGMDGDFDFNDVIIKETYNCETNEWEHYILAAGCQLPTELITEDYNGNTQFIVIPEIHEEFGLEKGDDGLYPMINTQTNGIRKTPLPFYTYGSADNIVLKVHLLNGEIRKSGANYYMDKDKTIPTRLTILGKWQWPIERTNVFEAYPLIGKWAKNMNEAENWFTQPISGSIYK